MRRVPAHAGRLHATERFTFALVFTLMAAFVVVVSVAAASPRGRGLLAGSASAATSKTVAAGVTGAPVVQPSDKTPGASQPAGTGHNRTQPARAALDARLAAALRPAVSAHPARISVGVIDTSTGAAAMYQAAWHFKAASVTQVDILAALLLQHQMAGTAISNKQAGLAATMMERTGDAAAARLWSAIGGTSGLASVNQLLKLRHTSPGSGDSWALTRTTVADQLQLLADLTSPRSPLASAGRGYELGLMASVPADQRWGASGAASKGASYAIRSGSLPDSALWVVNSIGVVEHDGHVLLIAVLSSHNPTKSAGMALVTAAAIAAADVITGAAR